MLADTCANLASKLVYLENGTSTVLRHVRLIDGTGAVPRNDVTIVIEGTRIASVSEGPAPSPTGPIREYDGRGLTVIPGLIDLHVHYSGDFGVTRLERYTPDVWQSYRDIRAVWHATQTLEAGFTTVRVLGHGRPSVYVGLRRAVIEGLVPGPRLLTAGWAISQTGGHGDPHFFPHELTLQLRPRSAFADGPFECRRLVRQNFGEGADLIKIYTTEGGLLGPTRVTRNFTLEEIYAMTDEAHARGARVAAHAMSVEGIRNAVIGGVDTIEHGCGEMWDSPELIELMIEKGTVFVPTLTVLELYCGGAPGMNPENVRLTCDWLDKAKKHLRHAVEMGLKVGCGTDLHQPGNNARELALLVECGLSSIEAISAATSTSAAALGLGEHLGTIEPGKVGELLALSVDPLANIDGLRDKGNIKWIFKSRDQLT